MKYAAVVERLFSWGPVFAFLGIEYSTVMMVYCLFVWWHPFHTLVGFLNVLLMVVFQVFGIYNFMHATFVGPGHVPLNWKPDNPNDEKFLTYCKICKGFKAPRAHHCRRCKRCVMKMDHHCPWINNCCGYRNHAYLTYFCLAVTCGRWQCVIILLVSIYKMIKSVRNVRDLPLLFYFCNFAVSISAGIAIAGAALLFVNLFAIIKNQTKLERFIVKNVSFKCIFSWTLVFFSEFIVFMAKGKNFVYPYDFGFITNLKFVFKAKGKANCDEVDPNDGILWKVKEGCDQYTLTAEAIKQSDDRRKQMTEYEIVNDFNGSFLPCSMGLGVMCCFPFNGEPRIQVHVGERVFVYRIKRYWLYGVIQPSDITSDADVVKGWFPSCCAVKISNDESQRKLKVSKSKKNE